MDTGLQNFLFLLVRSLDCSLFDLVLFLLLFLCNIRILGECSLLRLLPAQFFMGVSGSAWYLSQPVYEAYGVFTMPDKCRKSGASS